MDKVRRIDGSYSRSICGSSTSTITRPDNTTQYAIGDVIGTNPASNIEFKNILPGDVNDGHFYITDAKLEIEKSAVPANMSSFTLHLYNSAPTAIIDNSVWTLLLADGGKYLGSIDFNTPEDLGTTLIMWVENINIKRKLVDDVTSIYGQLVTNGNFTPAAEDVFNIQLETVGA